MADIFLSHSTEDRERLGPLVAKLKQRGWSVWWAPDIPTGRVWDDEIERNLAAARCVVVAWSRASVKSQWVRNEAREGLHRGVLIPVTIDPVAIPLEFRHLQAANLSAPRAMDGADMASLVAAVTSLAGPAGGKPLVSLGGRAAERRNDPAIPASSLQSRLNAEFLAALKKGLAISAILGILGILGAAAWWSWENTPGIPPAAASSNPLPAAKAPAELASPTVQETPRKGVDRNSGRTVAVPPRDPPPAAAKVSRDPSTGRSEKILRVGGTVTRPEILSAPQPAFTEAARAAKIQGSVILDVVIDESGFVTRPRVLKGLPWGLSEAALEAVKEWKFQPALHEGQPVAVYYSLSVPFRLNPEGKEE